MLIYIKSIPIFGAVIELFVNYVVVLTRFPRIEDGLHHENGIREQLMKSLKFLEAGIIIYFIIVPRSCFSGIQSWTWC